MSTSRTDHSLQRRLLTNAPDELPSLASGALQWLDAESDLLPTGGSLKRLGERVAAALLAAKAQKFSAEPPDLHLLKTTVQRRPPALQEFAGGPPCGPCTVVDVASVNLSDASYDDKEELGVARCGGGKLVTLYEEEFGGGAEHEQVDSDTMQILCQTFVPGQNPPLRALSSCLAAGGDYTAMAAGG